MPGIQRSSAFFVHARLARNEFAHSLAATMPRGLNQLQPLKRQRRPYFPPSAYWKPVQPEPAKFAVCGRSLPPIQPVRQRELARSSQKMLRKPSKSFGCIVVSLLPPSTACIGCPTIVLIPLAKPTRMRIDRGFEYPRRERFPDDIEIRPFLHVVTPVRC